MVSGGACRGNNWPFWRPRGKNYDDMPNVLGSALRGRPWKLGPGWEILWVSIPRGMNGLILVMRIGATEG